MRLNSCLLEKWFWTKPISSPINTARLNNAEINSTEGQKYSKDIWICQADEPGPLQKWENAVDFTLLPILMGFSVGFLILLQCVIWREKREKLYECMMLCNIWMMTLVYLTLIVVKTVEELNGTLCEILGIVFHFAYMSTFFWLTAMSHFIWKAFKQKPTSRRRQKYGFFNPKFKYYALFAFGCPALISILTVTLHHLPAEHQENIIAPRLGKSC